MICVLKSHLQFEIHLGLEFEHIKLVIEQLALLHATSYHFIQLHPGGLEGFKSDFEVMSGKALPIKPKCKTSVI